MGNSRGQINRIEMKNINKDIVGWLEDVIEENNGRVDKKEWKRKLELEWRLYGVYSSRFGMESKSTWQGDRG